MLLGTIHAFVAFFFIDALPMAAVMVGVAFAWMWFFIGSDNVASYWIVWPFGLLVAAAARYRGRRLRSFAPWPDTLTTPRQMLSAVVVVFSFTWYTQSIEDPASSLVSPFAVGAVLSLLIVTPALLILELVDHISGIGTTQSFQLYSVNLYAWVALLLIVAVDLLAWRHGWLLVVVGAATMITMYTVKFTLPHIS